MKDFTSHEDEDQFPPLDWRFWASLVVLMLCFAGCFAGTVLYFFGGR